MCKGDLISTVKGLHLVRDWCFRWAHAFYAHHMQTTYAPDEVCGCSYLLDFLRGGVARPPVCHVMEVSSHTAMSWTYISVLPYTMHLVDSQSYE